MTTSAAQETAIDDVSKAIIQQLQEDGRRSYATIGKEVGLSEAATRQRVSRLVEDGTVQIVGVTNPLQLGFARQAMLGLRVSGDVVATSEALAKISEVDYVVIAAGSFDLLVEIVCANDQDLLRIVNQQIRTRPDIAETETFVYLSLRKQKYNWGTR